MKLAESLDFRVFFPMDVELAANTGTCRRETHFHMRRWPYPNIEAWPGDRRRVAIEMIDRRTTLIGERVAEVLERFDDA